MSHFAIREGGKTVGSGVITELSIEPRGGGASQPHDSCCSCYDEMMEDGPKKNRSVRERLDELFRRLRALPRSATADEALKQLCETLDQVEDAWSGIPIDEGAAESSSPTLSLVVLQCANIQAARDFYSLLGLTFVEEQHGKGPRHFSTTIGSLVLEIYPCQPDRLSAPVRIGFRVPSLDQTLAILRSQSARIVREATDSPWGRRAVVEDPDGNRIELT